MDFQDLKDKIGKFVKEELYSLEPWIYTSEWGEKLPKLNELRQKVKKMGLWLPQISTDYGGIGLSLEEHGEISEILGGSPYGFYVFNCQAPDAGNMEILIEVGTSQQKKDYLKPLLEGKTRSCFAMTEPGYAGSNPVRMGTVAKKENGNYIINGHKWFTSSFDGADFAIVMVVTDPEEENPYKRASQIIVPINSEGVEFVRNISIMGHPGGGWESHAEIKFKNVIVPESNILGYEGDGFAIAQKRLGPGRIHHCMRLIGVAQRALELMCKRANQREAFGRNLIKFTSIRQDIAKSECEIQQARLLTLATADKIDKFGAKEAKNLIAMIKIQVPQMACNVVDRAIQIHGGMGVSQDTPLAGYYAMARVLRLADGPDEVHMFQLGRNLAKQYEI